MQHSTLSPDGCSRPRCHRAVAAFQGVPGRVQSSTVSPGGCSMPRCTRTVAALQGAPGRLQPYIVLADVSSHFANLAKCGKIVTFKLVTITSNFICDNCRAVCPALAVSMVNDMFWLMGHCSWLSLTGGRFDLPHIKCPFKRVKDGSNCYLSPSYSYRFTAYIIEHAFLVAVHLNISTGRGQTYLFNGRSNTCVLLKIHLAVT